MYRLDFGLGVIAGYEFNNGLSINFSYQAGLINTQRADKYLITMKNQSVGFVGIGYNLFP